MRCIDAGAHIGFYTCLMASLVGKLGTVHAFEPMASHFELLRRNIDENDFQSIVQAHQLACSEAPGHITASKISNMYVMGQVGDAERVTVSAVRLDDIIGDVIDFVKLDDERPRSKLRGIKTLKTQNLRTIPSEASFGESDPQRLKGMSRPPSAG